MISHSAPCGLLAAALLLLGAATPAPPAQPIHPYSPAQRAQLLHHWAEEALGEATLEGRERAARDLEQAIQLEPQSAAHWLLLGRVRVLGEYDNEALACFRRAVALDPRSASGYLAIGRVRKRQWLRDLDSLTLMSAIASFDTAVALKPHGSDAWLALVPLRYERGDLEGAAAAAASAMSGWPRYAEASLAGAYVAYRRGDIERADSLFRSTVPRLTADVRQRFETPGPSNRAVIGADPWQGLDPDPTTPENEFQLEYWSRLAHVVLLFYDPDRPEFDARADTYVRYGPPTRVANNPDDVPLYFRASEATPGKPPADYPTPITAWYYPELGMRVVLQDRSLHGHYQPRSTRSFDPGSLPDPHLLAERPDLESIGGGFMVMPKLPPRAQRLEVAGAVARFEGERGSRVLAQVETPGSPADTLMSRWVVTDTAGRVVARSTQPLAPAACSPAARREAQFAADLPPGWYRVAVSVRDSRRRRGLFEAPVVLEPNPPALTLSDLVPVCDEPARDVSSASLRFDMDIGPHFSGARPLVAYVEIYHLAPGPDRLARFEYDCEVRREDSPASKRGGRGGGMPAISTSRQESHLGALRRQFVSVPIAALGPGRYRLMVRVRDLVAGTSVERTAGFIRD